MAKEIKIEVDIEKEIIATMQSEKTAWEDEVVFITDKIAFNIRNLIKTCRKNYYGIFDVRIDPITGKKKVWPPLTQWLTEAVVKNVDIDSKDLNFKAKVLRALGLVPLVRNVVRHWVDENFFGEDLDMMERQLAIDGTVVWKTWEEDGKMVKSHVDLLNFYIDPNAESIQKTGAVIERSVVTIKDFKSMDAWWKKNEAKVLKGLHPTDENLENQPASETDMIETWQRSGIIPKSWITGKKEDKDTFIEGNIVVSSLNLNPIVHFVEENKKKDTKGDIVKPYEEGWLRRVPGRWHGMGVPEMLIGLQTWLNVVVNIRMVRATISQLGIFKIKRGRQITPQMLRKLAANGAILVNDMGDIEQMVMKEASESSYKDEEVITSWAQRVTQAYEAVTGEPLPASQTATSTVIQSRAAQSAFVLIKEGIGMFLQRWLTRHAWPILQKNLKKGDIARISGSYIEMRALDRRVVDYFVYRKLDEMTKKGQLVDPFEVERERIRAVEKLKSMGDDRFIEIVQNINLMDFDVKFFVTNEDFDKSVMVKDLISLGQIAPQYQDIIVRNVIDLMGIDINQFEEWKRQLGITGQVQQDQQGQQGQQGQQPIINPPGGEATGAVRDIVAGANVR